MYSSEEYSEFFQFVISQNKQLVLATRNMSVLLLQENDKKLTEEQENESLMVQYCKGLARTIIDTNKKITEFFGTEEKTVLEEAVLDNAEKTRSAVLDLIKCGRSVFDNPYDFVTKQEWTNKPKNLAANVRKLNSSLEALSNSINSPAEEDDDNQTNNIKQIVEKDQKWSNIIEDTKSASKSIKLLILTLKEDPIDPAQFGLRAKDLVTKITIIVEIAVHLNLNKVEKKLKNGITQVVSSSKAVFQKPKDEICFKQFESDIQYLHKSIKKMVLGVTGAPDSPAAAIMKKQSFHNLLRPNSVNFTNLEIPKFEENDQNLKDSENIENHSNNLEITISNSNSNLESEKIAFNIINLLKTYVPSISLDLDKKTESENLVLIQKISNEIEKYNYDSNSSLKNDTDINPNPDPDSNFLQIELKDARPKSLDIYTKSSKNLVKDFGVPNQNQNQNQNVEKNDDFNVLKELEKIEKMNHVSDFNSLQNNTVSRGIKNTLTRGFLKKKSTLNSNTNQFLIENGEFNTKLNENCFKILNLILDLMLNLNKIFETKNDNRNTENNFENFKEKLNVNIDNICNYLKLNLQILNSILNSNLNQISENMFNILIQNLERFPKRGILDDFLVDFSRFKKNNSVKILNFLENQIYFNIFSLKSLLIQLIISIKGLHLILHNFEENLIFNLISTSQCFINFLHKIFCEIETFCYILNHYENNDQIDQNHSNNDTKSDQNDAKSDNNIDQNLDEKIKIPKDPESINSLFNNDFKMEYLIQKNQLKGGTLNNIVVLLTNSETTENFIFTIFFTLKSFTKPEIFLKKILKRYNNLNFEKNSKNLKKENLKNIKKNIIIILIFWVNNFFQDFFKNKNLQNKILDFIEFSLKNEKKPQKKLFSKLKETISKKIEIFSIEKKIFKESLPKTLEVPELENSIEFILNQEPHKIAVQLTLIDFKLFSKINYSELLNQNWNSKKKKIKSQNILEIIERANRVSFWISTLILMYPNMKKRVKIIHKIILVAQELEKLNNYHGLMGIIAGMSTSSVSRLKNTFSKVNLKEFESLQELMSPSNSFKNYRTRLQESQDQNIPCVPYLGTYLSDLTFMEDGNPDFLDDEKTLINISKRELIGKVLNEITSFQKIPYKDLEIEEPLNTILTEMSIFSEKECYSLSLFREPRI